MSNTTENSFRNSLRNFNLTRTSSPIALPTSNTPSEPTTPFGSFRDSASNLFSNVSSSVQGYLPLNNGEEEEEAWYQMSRVEVSCVEMDL